MGLLTDPKKAEKFVYELEWTPTIEIINDHAQTIFAHLPNIFTQKPETTYFIENYKDHYALYDPEKPLMQVVNTADLPDHEELSYILNAFGFCQSLKFFQSDPTEPVFKDVEHLFFAHRHHTKTSVASLLLPIAGCDETTITSWPEYEDVDGYVPEDPDKWVYWSEYYWKTYRKNDERYLLSDEEAVCRYALTDKPVLWNVKQWHEAINTGPNHRVICNINFEDPTMTWEESVERVKGL